MGVRDDYINGIRRLSTRIDFRKFETVEDFQERDRLKLSNAKFGGHDLDPSWTAVTMSTSRRLGGIKPFCLCLKIEVSAGQSTSESTTISEPQNGDEDTYGRTPSSNLLPSNP